MPPLERLTLRIARLLNEAVPQQSAVLDSDQYCSPGKQRALLTLVLEIHDRMTALLERVAGIAELDSFDLSPVLSCRYDTPPDGGIEVDRIARDLPGALDALEAS